MFSINLDDEQCKRIEEKGAQLFIFVREYFFADNSGKTRLWDFSLKSCIYALLSYIQTGDENAFASFKELAQSLQLLRD